MGEDASIDEFGATADGDEAGDGTDDEGNDSGVDGCEANGDGDERERTNAERDDLTANDLAPTVTTYGWSPSGVMCEACGESTERRWRDDGAMVCRDCKEW